MFGIIGTGYNGKINWGGKFAAAGGDDRGGSNYGVQTSAYEGNTNCYGLWAEAGGCSKENWAGYFVGNVNVDGDIYLYNSYYASDLKLKKDVRPLKDELNNIKLLKPSTYLFRAEEFKDMKLPKEQQLGLIAQDLENVFPNLVSEVGETVKRNAEGNETGIVPAHKVINYTGLIPVLISGMQEQQQIIEELKGNNVLQQQQIDNQQKLIDQLLANKNNSATGFNAIGTIETGFQMSQNEPNPFTHETVVNYALPQSVNSAAMYVYDLTGKQIASFPINEKGASSMTITSEKLSAGIYIYSIVADGKVVDSKRMIVADK